MDSLGVRGQGSGVLGGSMETVVQKQEFFEISCIAAVTLTYFLIFVPRNKVKNFFVFEGSGSMVRYTWTWSKRGPDKLET